MNSPNSITGRPGATYRVNDSTGAAVARVSKMDAGSWGPSGWYDQRSMALVGFEEQDAVEFISKAGLVQAFCILSQ
jgi:hypothetical protein